MNATAIGNDLPITQPNQPAKKLTYPKKALGFAGITYIPGISETIHNHLKESALNLRIGSRPPEKISKVFTDLKHKLKPDQQSTVVIPCKQCGKCYICETSWSVFERCSQHKKDVRYIAKKPNKTALVSHVSEKETRI